MSHHTPLPVSPDEHRLPNGRTMKKQDVFGWRILDTPGRFMTIAKECIGIDHACQRKQINHARINRIAGKFYWYKFGVLSVFQRPDGSLWCADGQHRLLAARKVTDITTVPCLVFESADRRDEAKSFLGLNGDRGAVQTIDKFDTLVSAGDQTAQLVAAMFEDSGYRASRANTKRCVRCVAAVVKAAGIDFAACEVAWRLCVQLYAGDPPSERVFTGLWAIDRAMRLARTGTIAEAKVQRAILRAGAAKLLVKIQQVAAVRGRSTWKVAGEGIAAAINPKRGPLLVPVMAPGSDNGADHE